MIAWHFIIPDRLMAYTGTPIVAGETYRVEGPVVLCERGLHASERPIDALMFAPGPVVCRVEMGGKIVTEDEKCAATERTVIWMADATDVLRGFARQCAMDVEHLWDMPDVVRQYLNTGDESLRAAAWAAAWAAARAAASDAARAAQNNRLEAMLLALAPAGSLD